MRGWILLILFFPSATLADVRHNAIPVSLHGTWASSAQSCSKAHEAIVLTKNSYAGPKGRCSVPWVIESAGAHGTIYSAHLRCPSAGDAEGGSTLILMPKGDNQLSIGDTFEAMKSHERCSGR